MYEINTQDVCENFSKDKKNFSNFSAKSKFYDDSNKLVVCVCVCVCVCACMCVYVCV